VVFVERRIKIYATNEAHTVNTCGYIWSTDPGVVSAYMTTKLTRPGASKNADEQEQGEATWLCKIEVSATVKLKPYLDCHDWT
jgi:hypothetical protein